MLLSKLTQNELLKIEALKDKRGKGGSASALWHNKVKTSEFIAQVHHIEHWQHQVL